MVDATQLRFFCPWTHARSYASDGVGWGGDGNVRLTCTHGGCYATAFLYMLDPTPVMGWGGVGMLTFD